MGKTWRQPGRRWRWHPNRRGMDRDAAKPASTGPQLCRLRLSMQAIKTGRDKALRVTEEQVAALGRKVQELEAELTSSRSMLGETDKARAEHEAAAKVRCIASCFPRTAATWALGQENRCSHTPRAFCTGSSNVTTAAFPGRRLLTPATPAGRAEEPSREARRGGGGSEDREQPGLASSRP